jgi:hypothetical protein
VPNILKILGILLMAIATLFLALLGLAAAKGFFTIKYGLIVDLPARGRVVPVSATAVFAVVLSIATLGIVMFVAGKRAA